MRRAPISQSTNPFIAFTDVFLNMGMVFLLFILLGFFLGSKGWDNLRYRNYQDRMREAVQTYYKAVDPPTLEDHHDAPGEQRWVFRNIHFAEVGDQTVLTADSQVRLAQFVRILNLTRPDNIWHRIRIEASVHSLAQPVTEVAESEATELAAARAVAVEEFFYNEGHIRPYEMTNSSRGDQDITDSENAMNLSNDRIDVLVISPAYATPATQTK